MDEQDEQRPGPQPDDQVAERLGRVEAQLADFHRRSAHREMIIDRLHEENKQFRDGLRQVILEPVVTDLLRLYDSMAREAARLEAVEPHSGRLLASYADEVELAVERCGYQIFTTTAGDAYQAGRHSPVGSVATADPALDNTVAEPLGAGLSELDTDRVRRPARARFHRYQPPDESTGDLISSDHGRSE